MILLTKHKDKSLSITSFYFSLDELQEKPHWL